MFLTQAVGVFNIFVGLMLVVAFLLYFGALVGWAIRLGIYPGYRDEMIELMMWGNVVLFVLIVLLALVHFIQAYQAAAAFAVGLLIFVALVWLIMKAASAPSKDAEEHR
jgi:hypothetical protein